MLADPKLINTSYTATEDTEYLKKGQTYTFPIERLQEGVYRTATPNFHFHIGNLKPGHLILPDPIPNITEEDIKKTIKQYPNQEEGFVRSFFCKSEYGVADNLQQILKAYPLTVSQPSRQFTLGVYVVCRCDQPPRNGWRWEKWGEYIGKQKSRADYLADEPEIEELTIFHWYELLLTESSK